MKQPNLRRIVNKFQPDILRSKITPKKKQPRTQGGLTGHCSAGLLRGWTTEILEEHDVEVQEVSPEFVLFNGVLHTFQVVQDF